MGNSRSPSHLPTQASLAVSSTPCPATPLPSRIATVRPSHWYNNKGPTLRLSMRVNANALLVVLSSSLLQRKRFLLRYDDSYDRGQARPPLPCTLFRRSPPSLLKTPPPPLPRPRYSITFLTRCVARASLLRFLLRRSRGKLIFVAPLRRRLLTSLTRPAFGRFLL